MSVIITPASLSDLTTFGIGGRANTIIVSGPNQIARIAKKLAESGKKTTVIGNGSNIIASDIGYDGVVIITNKMLGATWWRNGNTAIIKADCGVSLTRLAKDAYDRGFSGLEWAEGIPATLGGAIVGNAGAFGGYISDVVKKVKTTGGSYSNKKCHFGYRESIFKHNSEIVLKAELRLTKGNKTEIGRKMHEYAERRRLSQPIGKSAGSIFKKHIDKDGNIIPAGALIESAGLKGLRVGGAVVSPKHANFIINEADATAKDVVTLIDKVIERVKEVYGITLETEVVYLK